MGANPNHADIRWVHGPFKRLLTAAEERALAAVIQHSTDPEARLAARNELVLRNRGLVVSLTKYYQARGHREEDLLQVGCLGLIEAAEKYDPDSHDGTRFSTYANYYIKLHIRDWIKAKQIVHTPWYMDNQTGEAYLRDRGPLSHQRFAVNLAKRAEAQRPLTYFQVRDSISSDDGENSDRTQVPADPRAMDPDQELERAETRAAIEQALEVLTPLERQVVVRHYGLGGCEPTNLSKVGDLIGFTREYVRQVHFRALAKLNGALQPYDDCA